MELKFALRQSFFTADSLSTVPLMSVGSMGNPSAQEVFMTAGVVPRSGTTGGAIESDALGVANDSLPSPSDFEPWQASVGINPILAPAPTLPGGYEEIVAWVYGDNSESIAVAGMLLCLALGPDDYLYASQNSIGRIKDGAVMWAQRIECPGLNDHPSVLATDDAGMMFVGWNATFGNFTDGYTFRHYWVVRSIAGTGVSSPEALRALPNYIAEDPAFSGSSAPVSISALVVGMPTFLRGVATSLYLSVDGAYAERAMHPIIGPVVANGGGSHSVAYARIDDTFTVLSGQYTVTLSGGTQTAALADSSAPAVVGGVTLDALHAACPTPLAPNPYDTLRISYGWTFGASVTDGFWTNLRLTSLQ